ncbi:transcription termination factor MTERF15, mitochondrial [Phalaenopsis equestris]|uniref:transcription termination factor MTERF15, mitochondrial n=1 Tax=Phalaenopsis equestris TaxID=78828 RepID=UPI0009E5D7C9|nr:transcription termination factor MTERF15, mitochondrial [Phalaenopsis equestris]
MILEQSARFKIEPEDFILSLRRMKIAGLSDGTVIRVFEVLPAAFMNDGIDVRSRIEFLKKTAGIKEQEEINGVCHSYPEFLAFSIDCKLRPLFSEFFDLGFDRIEVRNLLTENPSLLLNLQLGELSRCVNLLEGLKCRIPIKERILSRGRLFAAIDVKTRIDLLCRHGLTQRDAFKILHVEPRSILYSPNELEKKIQFLLEPLGFSIEHLVEFPSYLGLNLEKQIIPRLRVVELLRSKGALEMEVELKHFVRMSRREFYNFFVKPYPECEKIFGGLMRNVELNDVRKKKLKHPTGLWKLFKPIKYSDSEEDVKNMKQFMETLV